MARLIGTKALAGAFAVAVMASVGGSATAQQGSNGNMDTALNRLIDAKASLEKARPNKGGHRAKALRLVQDAISEVRKGIAYANKH